jgi:TonB family protein
MNTKLASSIALLWVALLAGPAHGQGQFRIGTFEVKIQADSVTGQDRSFAMLKPVGADSVDEEGAVLWACGRDPGGLSAGVRLEAYGDDGVQRRAAWRFDTEAVDTLVLDGEHDSALWYLGDHDLAAVTARARSASTLTIQMLGGPASRQGKLHRYTVAGLDSALSRLGCPAAPAAPRTAAGRETLRSIPQLIAVEEMPRPTNTADFARALARNYPPHLRDAGVQGEVIVRFRVLETGRVDSASMQVTRSSNVEFNAAALASVPRLRFLPARLYDRPVKVWVEQPINFALAGPVAQYTPTTARHTTVVEMMRYVERNYPRELRDAGVGGQVMLRFRLLEDGSVDRTSIQILNSTNAAFDGVARRAVQRLRYDVPTPYGNAQREVTETVLFTPPGARSSPRD